MEGVYSAGDVIADRYRIVAPISAGAMGAIYKAEEIRSGREVALKVLLEQYLDREDLVQRFEREARAVCDLDHPHIVHYYTHGQDSDGRPFLVTEFLQGRPGHTLVHREPPLTLPEVVHIITQVCSALAIAHSRGIVHRDLKWSNVMVTAVAGDPLFTKLIDFGILKYSDVASPGDRKKLTRAGVVLGTPEYVSPEQILGRPLDGRADLYAVAVMTYELLTGRRPFVASNKADLLVMQLKNVPPPMAEVGLRYELPPALEAAVMRGLEKNPEARFASVAYYSRALEAALGDSATAAPAKKPGGVWSWLRKK